MSIISSNICRVLYVLTVLALLQSCSSLQKQSSDGSFEGVVTVIEQYGLSEDMAINTTYYIKPNHLRMESTRVWKDEIVTVTLYDYNNRKMYTLLPDEKIYMGGSLPEDEEGIDTEIESPQSKGNLLNAKTGIMRTILGYNCEQWLFKNNMEGELEMWMTKGFPLLEGALGRRSDFSTGEGTMMSPFNMVIRKVDGTEVMRWEITNIEQKRLSNSIFTPPSDYRMIKRKDEIIIE